MVLVFVLARRFDEIIDLPVTALSFESAISLAYNVINKCAESNGWSRRRTERSSARKVRAPRAGCRLTAGEGDFKESATAVSYTHLDVYKRQRYQCCNDLLRII